MFENFKIMKNLKNIFIFIVFTIIIGCNHNSVKEDYTLRGTIFGTYYQIKYLNATKNYQKSIDSLFNLVNQAVSTYIPTSDISKINNGNTSIKVDAIFKEVFVKSKKIYEETNGYFDPTVGNLVNAYGFGPENQKKNLSNEEVKNQMQYVGLDKVWLENDLIIKEQPNVYLDFNSIAKGFAIDILARFLNAKNIDNYLIEIGGEIRAKGKKNNGKAWSIQITSPIKPDENGGHKIIQLTNKSMATSGNYRKFRIADDGKKYVHTINPKTGLATESNLLSASVISDKDCADVDAYATAFMAMGLEKTKVFLQQNTDVKVILLYFDDNGNMKEYSTYNYK